jgi:hypothetical protein
MPRPLNNSPGREKHNRVAMVISPSPFISEDSKRLSPRLEQPINSRIVPPTIMITFVVLLMAPSQA